MHMVVWCVEFMNDRCSNSHELCGAVWRILHAEFLSESPHYKSSKLSVLTVLFASSIYCFPFLRIVFFLLELSIKTFGMKLFLMRPDLLQTLHKHPHAVKWNASQHTLSPYKIHFSHSVIFLSVNTSFLQGANMKWMQKCSWPLGWWIFIESFGLRSGCHCWLYDLSERIKRNNWNDRNDSGLLQTIHIYQMFTGES